MKSKLRHFFLLTFSTLVMAAGTYFFKFPNHFTFGGITGLAVLVAKTGVMSAGDFNFITNMILLIIGFFILGKKFAAKTAYCSILLSVALSALERIYPMSAPLTNQPMLELCFAIALPSLGSAILFNIGSSSGGTDIIAMILEKIFQRRYRTCSFDHRCADHRCWLFHVRHCNRAVFIPWTCNPLVYDRYFY